MNLSIQPSTQAFKMRPFPGHTVEPNPPDEQAPNTTQAPPLSGAQISRQQIQVANQVKQRKERLEAESETRQVLYYDRKTNQPVYTD
jgi:hypothetical protein